MKNAMGNYDVVVTFRTSPLELFHSEVNYSICDFTVVSQR